MFGLFKKKKKDPDVAELIKLAKENDRDAQYQLSLVYYRGTSLAQNKEKSRYWLAKASEAVDNVWYLWALSPGICIVCIVQRGQPHKRTISGIYKTSRYGHIRIRDGYASVQSSFEKSIFTTFSETKTLERDCL